MSVAEAVDIRTGPAPAGILALQRDAFLRAGAPSLHERKDDIKRLRDAVKAEADRVAARSRRISATARGTRRCSRMSGPSLPRRAKR